MWRKLWFRTENEARSARHGADSLISTWTPPQQPVPAAAEAAPARDQAAEVAAFLDRVYTYQQC